MLIMPRFEQRNAFAKMGISSIRLQGQRVLESGNCLVSRACVKCGSASTGRFNALRTVP
jgi:hypothetical protein